MPEQKREERPAAGETRQKRRLATPQAQVLALHQAAGNSAVSGLVQRQPFSGFGGFGGLGYLAALMQTQMQGNDFQNAEATRTRIAADAQKQQGNQQKQKMGRWKKMQDTQTKIFEIQQDVTVNKARTQDKMFNKWDEYIRG